MTALKTSNYYRHKALFGIDIGTDTIKIVQLSGSASSFIDSSKKPKVLAYGYTRFDNSSINQGVIANPEAIAKATNELLETKLSGKITTNRVAMAIPAYRTFSRSIKIPNMSESQIKEAVELEAEQYIPIGLDKLYLDYQVVRQTLSDELEIVMIAAPKNIIDSYAELADRLNLELIAIESTLSATGRLFSIDKHSKSAAVIIDFGALSSDISIFDKKVIVSGTVEGGGVNFTKLIQQILKINADEAELAKTRYGLNASKKQDDIKRALEPVLDKIIKEIKRMLRYYEEHYGSTKPIKQIVTFGGGANMPGLSEYLTENLRMAVRHGDPWQFVNSNKLGSPSTAERSMYTNALGLALIDHKENF
jgi:type IV pilus assembly protein PilM